MRGSPWTHIPVNGRRVIVALGIMYIALAVLFPLSQTAGEMPFDVVMVVFLLTVVPGSVLFYGGYRLPRFNIYPTLYDRIASWCLVGVGTMIGILMLNIVVSGLTNFAHNALILTALSSGAGFGIGIYDAKARTRAREAEQRSRELAYQNNRLENFARMLAHELRNPLAIAKGYHQQSQPRNKDAAKEIALAHERVEEMIDILLVTVRGSKVNIDEKPIVITELAARVWNDLSVQTESATFVIDTEQTIQGDSIHIQHLLSNLFRNSIEHSEEEVIVRIGDIEDGFYVEDNGPGIPDGNLRSVASNLLYHPQ